MHDLDRRRGQIECQGQQFVQKLGALTPTQRQETQAFRPALVGTRFESGANRHARPQHDPRAETGFRIGKGRVRALHQRRYQAVGEADACIRLDQRHGHSPEAGREGQGAGRIAPDRKDRPRPEPPENGRGLGQCRAGAERATPGTADTAASERKHVDQLELVAPLRHHAGLDAPRGSHEHQADVRGHHPERVRHRDHRVDMTTGAAPGQEQGDRAHEPASLAPAKFASVTSMALASGGGPASTLTLRRERPDREMLSRMPMAAALTRSDEPP